MSELKPCPFCGIVPDVLDLGHGVYGCECNSKVCSIVVGATSEDRAELVEAWNKRATMADDSI